jgi:nucleoside-diphosphate-sugar epimerase
VLNSQNNSNKVYVENYNCVRDFVSTRFLSQSIDLMIKSKEIGIYNICSGSGFSYFQIIQEMLKFQGKYCDILNLNNVESSVIIGDPNKWYSLTKTKYLPDLNKEIINKLISNLPYNTFNTIIGTDDIIINENKPYTL